MMKRFFLFMVAAVLMIAASDANAQEETFNGEQISNLRKDMKGVRTQLDSIKILYNILDLTKRNEKPNVIHEMYPVAMRMNNDDLRLDLCRQVAIYLDNPNHISKVLDEVKKIKSSEAQKETETFLKMRRLSINSREFSEEQRQREIAKIINRFETHHDGDKYEQILDLFALVEFLRNDSQGELLTLYVNRLGELAYNSGFKLDAVPNLVFSEMAVIYSDTENYNKAVEADRHLLSIIADLEKKYIDMGRVYRKYNINRYVCYRRMLRNYPALSPGEAEKLYDECKRLSELGPTIKEDFTETSRVQAPYYMAIGNYKAAIPHLKNLFDDETSIVYQRQTLKRLIEAAEKTGDDETKLFALSKYNDILQKFNELKADERYKELQIKYDVKQLNERNSALEIENHKAEIDSARRMMTFVSVAFVIICLVLVIMLFNWGKSKKVTQTFKSFVHNLNEERNRIRQNVYYDADHTLDPLADIDDESEKNWERRFSRESKKGLTGALKFMTETIINDLMHISLVGKAERLRFLHNVSIDSAMRESYDKTPEQEKTRKVKIKYPENDYTVKTDRDCLTDLFAHVFSTMIKHSSENAHIELECKGIKDHKLYFYFTLNEKVFGLHDGPRLFDMLVNFDDMQNQTKNGMYICRMITMLIYCTLRSDDTYTGGYRYIFSMPADLSKPEC